VLLSVRDLHSYYGKSHVLQGVCLQVERGELVCLLGRNGVGKSTTLKSIMGIVRPRKGELGLDDQEISGKQPFQVARLGIGYVPEERRVFNSLTVHENLLIGYKPPKYNMSGQDTAWTIEKIYSSFPILKDKQDRKGAYLSGGEQQMLSIARSLLGNPRLILVDEPTEGLAPLIAKEVLQILSTIRQAGTATLMVEQNFNAAIKIADRFYMMSKGQIVFEGNTRALMEAEDLRKKYLEV
jgi:branched-chain amino acid transport system ATP-binding protein